MHRRAPPAVHRLVPVVRSVIHGGRDRRTRCANGVFCLLDSGRLVGILGFARCCRFCARAQRLTHQVEALVSLHHPVQNRVCNGGIPNPRMPVLDGQLAGDYCGFVGSAVINDLQQIGARLGINAGHDLNRDNLSEFLREVPGVLEVSIGHALIADALELGYTATVKDYLRCIDAAFDAS